MLQLQFSIEMGRPITNNSFLKKHRKKWNKNFIKKFEEESKEMLAQSDLGSWYHQSFWENQNHFDISSSRQKIVLPEEDIDVLLKIELYLLCANKECANRTEFFSTQIFKDKSTFQINAASSTVGMRSIGRSRSSALKLLSMLNFDFLILSQPSWTKKKLLVSESEKIKEKNMAQACYEVKQKISEIRNTF